MKLIVLIASVLVLNIGCAAAGSLEWYETKYDSVREPEFDDCLKLDVSNFAFECDTAAFLLESGKLYFFPKVNGRIYCCAFIGEGKVCFDPPTAIERYSLKRHLKTETLDRPITKLLMMASPEFVEGLFDMSSVEEGKPPVKLRRFVNSSKYHLKESEWNVEATVLAQLLGQTGTYVWINVDSKDGHLAFVYDESATEALALYKYSIIKGGDSYELVVSAFPKDHYATGKSWKHRDPVRHITPMKYTIDAQINERAHLRCKTRLDFVSNVDSLIALEAGIFYKTDIDSVIDSDGRSLYVSKLEKESGFTVMLHESLSQGDSSSITFYYRSEEIISKTLTGEFYIASQGLWYPIIEYQTEALFDASFRCHKGMTVLSIGDRVSDSVSGDIRSVRWVTRQPEMYSTFNYGLFDTLTMETEDVPTVKIYRSKSHRSAALQEDMKENVGRDVVEALKLCKHLYGDILYDTIYVTEIPSGGQGSPGLIHLSWTTFQSERWTSSAAFRAHEVAHQWWGHTVQWGDYHDQWLSEAFAEFTGALYVQARFQDNKKYMELVSNWRKDILQKGDSGFGWEVGTEAGPIWLGRRLISSKSSNYRQLVYSKGAYIIHMLRYMMKDWTTGSDQRFVDMMREFVQTNYRKIVTTDDLQQMVEKHIGKPMDWFFDQWIYGTEIPEFKFKKKLKEESGMYLVEVEVIQKQVSDNFKSIIPIRIDFSDDQWVVVNVTAIGEKTTTTLPPLPLEPRKISFNYCKAVLAR